MPPVEIPKAVSRPGLRLGLEAAFLIFVAVIAGWSGVGALVIVLAEAIAFAIVAVVEVAVANDQRSGTMQVYPAPPAFASPEPGIRENLEAAAEIAEAMSVEIEPLVWLVEEAAASAQTPESHGEDTVEHPVESTSTGEIVEADDSLAETYAAMIPQAPPEPEPEPEPEREPEPEPEALELEPVPKVPEPEAPEPKAKEPRKRRWPRRRIESEDATIQGVMPVDSDPEEPTAEAVLALEPELSPEPEPEPEAIEPEPKRRRWKRGRRRHDKEVLEPSEPAILEADEPTAEAVAVPARELPAASEPESECPSELETVPEPEPEAIESEPRERRWKRGRRRREEDASEPSEPAILETEEPIGEASIAPESQASPEFAPEPAPSQEPVLEQELEPLTETEIASETESEVIEPEPKQRRWKRGKRGHEEEEAWELSEPAILEEDEPTAEAVAAPAFDRERKPEPEIEPISPHSWLPAERVSEPGPELPPLPQADIQPETVPEPEPEESTLAPAAPAARVRRLRIFGSMGRRGSIGEFSAHHPEIGSLRVEDQLRFEADRERRRREREYQRKLRAGSR